MAEEGSPPALLMRITHTCSRITKGEEDRPTHYIYLYIPVSLGALEVQAQRKTRFKLKAPLSFSEAKVLKLGAFKLVGSSLHRLISSGAFSVSVGF